MHKDRRKTVLTQFMKRKRLREKEKERVRVRERESRGVFRLREGSILCSRGEGGERSSEACNQHLD